MKQRTVSTGEAEESRKVALLAEANVFSTLRPEELYVISEFSEYRHIPAGGAAFRPGDEGDALFIIDSGQVVIRRESEDGPTDVARFISGECFGELDLLRNAPRTALAVAETECRLLMFPRAGTTFEEVLQEHPAISAQLLHKLLAQIAGRIRSANKLISANTPWIQELRRQVMGDKLTGLYNNTFLKEEFKNYLKDPETPVSLLMVKPDNFKEVNDTYGHEAGDETLQRLAATLKGCIGADDVAIRYRGNELAAILQGSDRRRAAELAEHVRREIKRLDITDLTGGASLVITASLAVTTFPEDGSDPAELTLLTHEQMFTARNAGGDRLFVPQ